MNGSPQPTDLAMFYGRAPIILWVEDRLSREYLGALWGDPADVAFYVAGGESGVQSMVRDAVINGFRHVSGIVDHEFGETNLDRWPSVRGQGVACRLPGFEIENYLLDPEVLAACSPGGIPRTSAEIMARIRTEAVSMVWWMACNEVRSAVYGAFARGFPEAPARGTILDEESATRHILEGEGWWGRLRAGAVPLLEEAEIRRRVSEAGARYRQILEAAGEEWLHKFAGREILRAIRDFVRPPAGRPRSEADIDLAKDVVAEQCKAGRIPADLARVPSHLRESP